MIVTDSVELRSLGDLLQNYFGNELPLNNDAAIAHREEFLDFVYLHYSFFSFSFL